VGARVVLAGRKVAALRLGRLRARRMLLEVGPSELALSRSQARQLFDDACAPVATDVFDVLYEQTEGWPAGVYLAALAARRAADRESATREFDGADPTVVEYLTAELLETEGAVRLAFLERTSVLDRFSAPLCDAVLGREDSASVLGAMEQSNGFVIALDRRRQWYRYHRLFGQALRAELARREPGQSVEIHQRASRWHEAQGDHAQAIEYALAARDERRVAEVMSAHLQTLFDGMRAATLRRWLESLSDAVLASHASLSAAGAWTMFQFGEIEKARRYMRLVDCQALEGPWPMGEVSAQSAVALLKSTLAWDGVSRIVGLAERVRGDEPRLGRAYRAAALSLGAAYFLQDRVAAARNLLEDAADLDSATIDIAALAQALLALLELEERQPTDAATWVQAAQGRLERGGAQGGVAAATLSAAHAWLDVAQNDRTSARTHLDQAMALLPRTAVVPWLAIYVQIVTGRVALELDDAGLAAALREGARRGLTRYPDAGVLPHLLARLERAQEVARGGGRTLLEPLTQAELRVLELAPTCLTIEEIGRTLCVSKNTVKTHLKAIYGKLNVASRSEAVHRAQALRLIDRQELPA
jgi:LuxR family maltose regulon positive regulatory protein